MHLFEILGQPIRFRIVEMLVSGEHLSGEIEDVITHEYGVGRSAVQHHLAILREHDWVIVRPEEAMRGYRLNDEVLGRMEYQVRRLRRRWRHRTGWKYGAIPLRAIPSRRGRRGHGIDPDDPWQRYYKPKPEPRGMTSS